MSNLIGQFYFKRTDNGNLLGEFSNQHSTRTTTESADIIHNNFSDFRGTYNSTWQENGTPVFSILTIDFKPETRGVFSLTWRIGNNITFWGEGFLVDNTLIGHYRNFQNIN